MEWILPDELAQEGWIEKWFSPGEVDFPHAGIDEELQTLFGLVDGEHV